MLKSNKSLFSSESDILLRFDIKNMSQILGEV